MPRAEHGQKRSPPPAAALWTAALPRWVAPALILIAAVVLYVPALHTSFFADDYLFLDQVRSRSLPQALATPDPLSNFYRPVSRQLYFWTIAGTSHESALAFHAGNLALFLVLLALLFILARWLAGTFAATFATALVALHYTADVPIRWACGSQELLAVTGALATLILHLRGRRALATVAMTIAALSKEVVLLTPLIAMIADWRPGERLRDPIRRAWPLNLGVAVWAGIWLLAPHTRQAASTEVEISPWGPLATYVHLIQIVLGAEARQGELWRWPTIGPPIVPLVLALVAVYAASSEARFAGLASAGPAPRDGKVPARVAAAAGRHAILTGITWALLATLPVIAVAILWSAYYYLYAMCGVAIALGAWLAPKPRALALVTLALLAWGSNSARHITEFATPRSPWTAMSHINKFYIERATRYCERYLEDLRHSKPSLPKSSTVFYAGLKSNIAFQVANGPLLRWAYRDSSLRSYYLNTFTLEKARRGPMFFFVGSGDSLREMEGHGDLLSRIAFSMLVSDWPPGANDALTLALEQKPGDPRAAYWQAWCRLAAGDSAGVRERLERAGYTAIGGPTPEVAEALALGQAARTGEARALMESAVRRHALDPTAHALLADLLLIADPDDPSGVIEAFAARLLAPRDPVTWRRWGMVQSQRRRYLEALGSFDRYFALAGLAGQRDGEAKRWVADIKRALPGGDAAPEGLRQ